MTIRERLEKEEEQRLSRFATLSSHSKGRDFPSEICDFRTEFQRDRDKIIHSKAFRRLKHKTQVFITPEGDHYRTRLTHTLEVAQIGRTIARALRLNEDLTEAIALGHDLGHTPFGHEGERALNSVCPLGFQHNEQSLRVVSLLENGVGLNLTEEVRDGILHHTGDAMPATPEGEIIRLADKIAYINHDIDDAIRGGIICEADLPLACVRTLGEGHSKRIDSLVRDVIENSFDSPHITMSHAVEEAMLCLRDFMFETVYIGSEAKKEEKKAGGIVAELYRFFLANYDLLPEDAKTISCEKERRIMDYIAGMTDTYAMHIYKKYYLPKGWYR